MAVPGLLLSLLYRHGVARAGAVVPLSAVAPMRPFAYFHVGLAGYAAGLVVTLAVAVAWANAQPALLFLVPATVVPVAVLALARGDAVLLWHPPVDTLLPPP